MCSSDLFPSHDKAHKKRRLPVMVDGELVLLDEHEPSERQEEIKIKLSENKRSTKQEEKKTEMKICPSCSVMNSSENITCHICGYDFTSNDIPTKKRRLPVMVDGELVLLDEHELTERQEEIKIKLSENKRHTKREEKKTEMKRLSQEEKLQVLKNGLGRKNNMFEKGKLWI